MLFGAKNVLFGYELSFFGAEKYAFWVSMRKFGWQVCGFLHDCQAEGPQEGNGYDRGGMWDDLMGG